MLAPSQEKASRKPEGASGCDYSTEGEEMLQTKPWGQERMLFSKGESAYALNISDRKLDYLIAEKAIRVRRIGKRVLITRDELERFAKGK